jgi:integration host factor subunit alpha
LRRNRGGFVSLTKADIVRRIQEKMGYSQIESQGMVESFLGIIKETIETGETLKISGFGSFVVKQKKDRRGRNPQTGESITIGSRRVVTFKPSALVRKALNGNAEG